MYGSECIIRFNVQASGRVAKNSARGQRPSPALDLSHALFLIMHSAQISH